jgi:UDP-3-O-[3-hydroxymyristoyl] glucosamine N-acyltransferase
MNSFLKVNITLKELSSVLKCNFRGNPDEKIFFIGDINYTLRGFGTFQSNCIYYAENDNTFSQTPENAILLTTNELAKQRPGNYLSGNGHPKEFFIKLLNWFEQQLIIEKPSDQLISKNSQISPSAVVYPGVFIGNGAVIEENCVIKPFAVIKENSLVKKNTIIHSGVHIGHHCQIGENNIIYSNSVIGSDGFGYADFNGKRYKIPQIGNVVTGNFVEIGACTTIDRSTIESTIIGDYTKIDNQVHIAHNCVIGKNVYMAGKASTAGSVVVGDGAILAGACAIKDHLTIAEGSVILGMTGMDADSEPGKTYYGIPGRPVKEMHRINAALNHLPEIIKKMRKNDF